MIYRWFADQIKDILKGTVAEITVGGIPTGEYKDVVNEDGSIDKVPIKKNGIEIRTKTTLADVKLRQLDKVFAGYQRASTIAGKEIK